MTKIRFMSDLHIEIGAMPDLEPAGEDVLVLAGDIGVKTEGAEWALDQARKLDVPVVYVCGNHEFYRGRSRGGDLHSVIRDIAELAAHSGGALTFLENGSATVAGVRFIGATLWTDFDLYGTQSKSMLDAKYGMNDYKMIQMAKWGQGDHFFTPLHALQMYEQSVVHIAAALSAQPSPCVVVTHMAPSARSIDPRYEGHECTPAYASHLDQMIEDIGPDLWVHGHVHVSHDYVIGKTRIMSNPRGYAMRHWGGRPENADFNPNLIVEI